MAYRPTRGSRTESRPSGRRAARVTKWLSRTHAMEGSGREAAGSGTPAQRRRGTPSTTPAPTRPLTRVPVGPVPARRPRESRGGGSTPSRRRRFARAAGPQSWSPDWRVTFPRPRNSAPARCACTRAASRERATGSDTRVRATIRPHPRPTATTPRARRRRTAWPERGSRGSGRESDRERDGITENLGRSSGGAFASGSSSLRLQTVPSNVPMGRLLRDRSSLRPGHRVPPPPPSHPICP